MICEERKGDVVFVGGKWREERREGVDERRGQKKKMVCRNEQERKRGRSI